MESLPPSSQRPWWRKLHWQITTGLVLGLIYGILVRIIWPMPEDVSMQKATLETWHTMASPFAFVGDLFMRALKMIIIPLIVASVITGIQSLGDAKKLGSIGSRTIIYYMATTLIAVTLGIICVNMVDPGVGLNLSYEGSKTVSPTPLGKVFSNIIPKNMLAALTQGNMLPTIFVSILFGLAMLILEDAVAPLRHLFDALNLVMLKITDWVMSTAPLGVMALFVTTLLDPKLADVSLFMLNLGKYMCTVVLGLGLHAVVFLPILYFLLTKKSPRSFAQTMAPSLLTAYSTASSSATYPVTLECAINAGVSKESASFVLPLGATINMDGTALYEAVAAVFIANALGIDLSFTQQLLIVITATLAAIGAAGVPSAGLVTMVIVLESVGLPGEAYGIVVAVDRVLDMCRTSVNVWGDAIGAAIISESMPEPTHA